MKLVLLDPSEAFRIGLWAVLSRHRPDLDVVADSGRADPEAIAAMRPDLVVTDLHIQPGNAIGLLTRLRELGCPARVAVMSRQAPVAVVRQMLAAGASGFLLSTLPAAELVEAVDRMLNGGTAGVPAPAGSDRACDHRPAKERGRPKLESLSRRERQVFDLVIWGWANKEIADHLSISVKTVETHRTHINGKLGARSSADIVRVAAFAGALDGAGPPLLPPRAPDGASAHSPAW